MLAPGANALRVISALLFLWATASTFACFVLLANQNLGNSLPRRSDLSVNSLRSSLSSDIFDSPAFGNLTDSDADLYGISRRTALESGDEEDEVAFSRRSSEWDNNGAKASKLSSKDSSLNNAEDDPGHLMTRRKQGMVDVEDSGSQAGNGLDEERAFAVQSAKKGDEVDELLEGVQKSLVNELTETNSRSKSEPENPRTAPLSSCDTFTAPGRRPHDPWASMKWMLPPARCRVQGLPIEELDSRYNFRRGFALGFTEDEEDKTHLLPYLRAAHDPSLQERKRRILIDLGAGKFESSVRWFLNFYPLDFTEIHVFEEKKGLLSLPGKGRTFRSLLQSYDNGDIGNGEEETGSLRSGHTRRTRRKQQVTGTREISSSIRKRTWQQSSDGDVLVEDLGLPKHLDPLSRSRPAGAGPWPLPQWALDRITLHEKAVSQFDSRREINITRFMIEELGLTEKDAVVIKMDIEFNEWFILHSWLIDPEMPYIVDDLFVEFHYNHYSMKGYGWDVFQKRRTRVLKVLSSLRVNGFYAHFWP